METTYRPEDAAGRDVASRSAVVTFLLHYADGHAPLWKAFWIWGVALSWLLFALFAGIVSAAGLSWPLFIVAAIVMMPYTAWILVAVWLCAFNTDNELWGYTARFLTVVWSVNIGVAGGFLMSALVL